MVVVLVQVVLVVVDIATCYLPSRPPMNVMPVKTSVILSRSWVANLWCMRQQWHTMPQRKCNEKYACS